MENIEALTQEGGGTLPPGVIRNSVMTAIKKTTGTGSRQYYYSPSIGCMIGIPATSTKTINCCKSSVDTNACDTTMQDKDC